MGHIVLPGSSGNYLSTPDSAAVSVTDTFDVQVCVALTDWDGSNQSLLSKWTAAGNNKSWYFLADSSGFLVFGVTDDGASAETTAVTTPAFTDGTIQWLRVTFNGGAANFYQGGSDPETPSWTQIGTEQTFSTHVAVSDEDSVLEIGSINAGTAYNAAGSIYRARLYDDLTESTTVFDADMRSLSVASGSDGETFTEDSSNAATVTIHGTSWSYVPDSGGSLLLLGVG